MPSPTENYSRQHQFDLLEMSFYRLADDGTVPEKTKWIDLAAQMEEFNLFEDIMAGGMTAQLLLTDGFNLPDRLPILGGERIRIRFKTASFEKEISVVMVIHKVGERFFSQGPDKAQMYWLYLSTEDGWNNAQMDVSFGHKGTYTGLVERALTMLGSTRPKDLMTTTGIVQFISPYWSPLRICSFAAERGLSTDGDPIFFWETPDGYQLKNLLEIYKQAPIKKIFIEPRNTNSILEHGDKLFNVVQNWNYAKSDDRLTQNRNGDFGSDVYYLDTTNWNFDRQELKKVDIEIIRIDKFPIVDSASKTRSKTQAIWTRPDGSHQNYFKRKAVLDRLDNKRIVVEIPGDSTIHAGQTLDLDVPSATAGIEYIKERVASGKFLIASCKHILIRDRYRMNLELLKDATEERIL